MATEKTTREAAPEACPQRHEPLTGFECRCLRQRLEECEQALRRALLGIAEARAKTHDSADLVDIGDELAQAESHLVRARYVAAAGAMK